ncbi:MAG TPA: hypothetical protein VFL13_12870 [Candidatus Baltobacteraceae bacterium]|nr:hypothetical protein [Candidatus Baltobacteraceae bacterium]
MLLNASFLIAAIYAGLQGLVVTGVHTDAGGAQRGVAPGALIEIGAQGRRFGFRVEGIPPVSLPQAPSAYYGAAVPQLSLFNGAVRYAVNPAATFWVGAGATVINQRTPLPNLSQVVGSRLAGMRYELMYRAPLHGGHFIEILAGGVPHLTGADHFDYSIPHPGVTKPEIASEEDGQVAWGVRTRTGEFLFGARSINFSARFAATGEAADRNNGGGVMVEWRRFLWR